VENYRSIEGFSSNIREAADQMTSYNHQLVSDISQLMGEVSSTVLVVQKLAGAMDVNMQQHTRDLEIYQQNFTNLMIKLSQEIAGLGQKAALSFSEAMTKNSAEMSEKIKTQLEGSYKGILHLLDQFRENQNHFAKTIASLPDQILAYHEVASVKRGPQQDGLVQEDNK
jgi:hypothetical protein